MKHLKMSGNRARFVCDICKIIFHKETEKILHDQLKHNIEIGTSEEHSNLPSFQCSVKNCNHFFTHLSDYNRHFGVAHSRVIIKRQEKQLKETAEIIEGQRYMLNNKEIIINLLERQVENSDHYSGSLKRQIEDTILCKICFERNRNMCFRPCRHIYACMQCGNDPSINTCPVCTLIIRRKERVYFP